MNRNHTADCLNVSQTTCPALNGCRYRGQLALHVILLLGILLSLTSTSLSAAETKNPRPKAIVIRGGTVFDSLKGEMVPDQTIVIRGDRIEQVGPQAGVKTPRGARVIDARGKFIIPGLMDAHAHIVFHKPAQAHLTGDEFFPMFLACGVTSIRETGDAVPPQVMLQRYAKAHPETSPRVFTCSMLIDGANPYHRDISWALPDAKDVPAYVEDMANWGCTTLKLYVGTGREVGKRVIQEGHKRGLMVSGHLGYYTAQDASDDGIDTIEHIISVLGYTLPEGEAFTRENILKLDFNNPRAQDLMRRLVKNHTRVDPTLAVFQDQEILPDLEMVNKNPDLEYTPMRLRRVWDHFRLRYGPETLADRRKEFKKYQELTGVCYRAGVTLLCGTDTAEAYVIPGFSLLDELQLMVDSGIPPAAVLQSATINNADSVKMKSELGSITPGKFADMVILSADPLADIRNARKIDKVIHVGLVLDPKELLNLVPRE